jgi:hypothetical protein
MGAGQVTIPWLRAMMVAENVCDCNPAQLAYHGLHDEECTATPVYAELVEEIDSVFGILHDLDLARISRLGQFQMWWNTM